MFFFNKSLLLRKPALFDPKYSKTVKKEIVLLAYLK